VVEGDDVDLEGRPGDALGFYADDDAHTVSGIDDMVADFVVELDLHGHVI